MNTEGIRKWYAFLHTTNGTTQMKNILLINDYKHEYVGYK